MKLAFFNPAVSLSASNNVFQSGDTLVSRLTAQGFKGALYSIVSGTEMFKAKIKIKVKK